MTSPDIAEVAFEGLRWLEDCTGPLDWNGPTARRFTRFRDADIGRSIIMQFERVAHQYPDRVAVADSQTSLTYGALWGGVSGLAETIAACTRPGALVGIALPTCALSPLAMLACWAAGRPFVALDTQYPRDWLNQVLADAQPALIIGQDEALAGAATGAPMARVVKLTHLPQAAQKGWRPAELSVDQPACVLFTSGSTGRPKGIVNSQRNLLQRVAQSINSAHINAEDRFLTLASLCTIVGVRDAMTALLAGASVRLVDVQSLGAREILHLVRAERVTILFAFPALLRSVLASAGARANDALRLVRVGGDTTLWSDIDLLRAWLAPGSAIQSIYAATEAPMMQWFVDDAGGRDDPRVPIGYPLAGNRLAVIDEEGRAAPQGEIGELIVASPFVSLGFWVHGRMTTDGAENRDAPGCRVFRTGDLVRQRPDGLLERVGRKDRRVKIRGVGVELDGVEASLRRHGFVRDVAVVARTAGADASSTLVAFVSARDGAPGALVDELRRLMQSAPAAMRPGRFYLVDEIPRLPSSKLDARALLALDAAQAAQECATPVCDGDPMDRDPMDRDQMDRDHMDRDYIESAAAQAWRKVLHAPAPGGDDDFFDAGGDSLKAIAFLLELEQTLGLELSVTVINEAPRFAQLCEALRAQRACAYVPLVALKAGEGLAPVFFIHGIGGNVLELFATARRMQYPGPVFGIQARGLGGREQPHPSVAAMAEEYLREIKARQPTGPYHLCGYSFGGLVAFEMARRLRNAGDEVGLVGLFDTMMSPVRWPLRAWVAIGRRQIAELAARVRKAPVHRWPLAIWTAGRRIGAPLRRDAKPIVSGDQPLPAFMKSAPAAALKVAASALFASARYRPQFYDGDLILFTPGDREPGLPPLEAIWRKHARAVTVVETGGTHATMLSTPHAEATADALTQCLLTRACLTNF